MSSNPVSYVTPEAYLAFERGADAKHEYVAGEIAAMAGGSPAHSLIAANVAGALGVRLEGRCLVFNSDLRVCAGNELITYADVTVLCGHPAFLDDQRDTLTNPAFICEVLSPSTENFDRGEKARLYRALPSIGEFLLISQTPVEIEHFSRINVGKWEISTIRDPNAVIPLPTLGCDLPVVEIYRGIELLKA